MMLAAQLWLGYLAAHPGWLITYGLGIPALLAGVLAVSLIDGKATPADRAAQQQWNSFIAAEKRRASPPAEAVPLFPAGDVPGPGSPPLAPEEDAGPHARVLGPGPGTPRNGPPWEQCCHDPGHDHAPGLWGPDAHHQQVTAAIGGQ